MSSARIAPPDKLPEVTVLGSAGPRNPTSHPLRKEGKNTSNKDRLRLATDLAGRLALQHKNQARRRGTETVKDPAPDDRPLRFTE